MILGVAYWVCHTSDYDHVNIVWCFFFSEDADADVDYSQCGINNDSEDADGDDNEWFEQKVTLW